MPNQSDQGRASTPYSGARTRVRAGASPRTEAEALVARMTSDEKLGCLDGDTDFWDGLIDMAGGGYYRHTFPAARVRRLGFPGLSFSDGPRGIVVGPSTCFPVPMARGASFDPSLEERIGEAIGVEARIQGADFFGGVCVNLLRHPAWGRAQETYGEDPFHVGEMGAALTRGVQRHVMACVKHFACNSIENARFRVNVLASPDVLDEVYLPHFRRVVREGVAAVMTAYNSVNGEWCGQSHALIRETLRERWGFDGIVMSDFVYGLRDAVESVRAGLDIEMPFRQLRSLALADALASGALEMAAVDACVARIVATVLRFDAARADEPPPASLLACDAHRSLAREAARSSIVLLKNEGAALPIARGATIRICVAGALADAPNLGDGGSSNVHPPSVVTPLDGLRAALPHAVWTDDPGDADVAIVVVGLTRDDEGEYTGGVSPELFALMPPAPDKSGSDPDLSVWERLADAARTGHGMALGGDRVTLRLKHGDEELIRRVAAAQPRTVVVLIGGSAIVVEAWIESVAAVLHAWYPGMEGGHAIADVVTGVAEPGGRMPFAVPTDEAHLPFFDREASVIRYDRWHGQWLLDRDDRPVRFPFGFGLSYASIALGSVHADGNDVLATVRNSSARDGSTVVFAFRGDGAAQRLVAFCKVHVPANSVATAQLHVETGGTLRIALHARDAHAREIVVAEARP